MAVFKPFYALRPTKERAKDVAALPYDVMSSGEARVMASGNPFSFLHVDKAEIDLDPSVDIYSEQVYLKARENLNRLVKDGILVKDAQKCYYIYRLTMDGRSQTGIVGCASIDDYADDIIKKHELTRADKEADRIRHVDCLDANTGPIFMTCRPDAGLSGLAAGWASSHEAAYDFISDDGVGHTVWVIDDPDTIAKIEETFSDTGCLYIADGHHRCASAYRVGQMRRAANPGYTGNEEFNFFLSVVFPSDELAILDYNRVARDLNGNTPGQFIEKLKTCFDVEPHNGNGPYKPEKKHVFGMYLDGKWYRLTAKPDSFQENDPVSRLDVSILQRNVLGNLLGIDDPRTDKRVDFVGGIRGLNELEARVENGMAVAFSMYPTGLDDLMAIADTGLVMPPKSTWFEPKLRCGLFIHELS